MKKLFFKVLILVFLLIPCISSTTNDNQNSSISDIATGNELQIFSNDDDLPSVHVH